MFSNHDPDSSHAYLTTFTGTGLRSPAKSAAKISVTLFICVTDISVTLRRCPPTIGDRFTGSLTIEIIEYERIGLDSDSGVRDNHFFGL